MGLKFISNRSPSAAQRTARRAPAVLDRGAVQSRSHARTNALEIRSADRLAAGSRPLDVDFAAQTAQVDRSQLTQQGMSRIPAEADAQLQTAASLPPP